MVDRINLINRGGVLKTLPDKWLNKCYYPQAPHGIQFGKVISLSSLHHHHLYLIQELLKSCLTYCTLQLSLQWPLE